MVRTAIKLSGSEHRSNHYSDPVTTFSLSLWRVWIGIGDVDDLPPQSETVTSDNIYSDFDAFCSNKILDLKKRKNSLVNKTISIDTIFFSSSSIVAPRHKQRKEETKKKEIEASARVGVS